MPSIDIVNSPNRFVLCGPPASLVAFKDAIDMRASTTAKKKKGLRPGTSFSRRGSSCRSPVRSTRTGRAGMEPMREVLRDHNLYIDADAFAFPVFDRRARLDRRLRRGRNGAGDELAVP